MSEPVSITLNGRVVVAQPGELLIEAAEHAGVFIPRFCYHPRMEPVGVCRMCLVEVEGPRGSTLQPSCFVRVNDGMVVNTDSDKAKKAQDGVLEFLLANHPLDCPVCDKGGECPLQDQTLAYGPGESRFIEEKRHFVKPVEIGPLVLLDRERCIQCSRCTRFAAQVAGDAQIDFAGRGDLIEVATSPTQPFDSIFSGNTVQICPVGALTARPYRFSARPWDLSQVESTCTTCAVGCRVAVQSSGNRLTRVLGVDSDAVNHGWLCDKGRFTLDAVDGHADRDDPLDPRARITTPLVRRDGGLVPTTWGDALARAAALLRAPGPDGVGAIGGAALTNEGAFAWQQVLRDVLGSPHLDAQYGDGLDPTLVQSLPAATIDDAAAARVVVTLTGDLREELPVLFLRLRAGIAAGRTALIELASGPSALRSLARVVIPVVPGEAADIASALVDGARPASADAVGVARELLGDGEGVVVVVGRANLAEHPGIAERAALRLATGLPKARFLVALRRGNVRGALDMGLVAQWRPGRVYDASARGRDTRAQLEALRRGEQGAVVLLGADVLGNVLDRQGAAAALDAAAVVAVTGHGSPTLAYADVVLPAHVQHERNGTVTNLEGRVSAVVAKVTAPGAAWSDVTIAAELAAELGQALDYDTAEAAAAVIEQTTGYPTHTVLTSASIDGVVAATGATSTRRVLDPIAFPGIASADAVGLASFAGDTLALDVEIDARGNVVPTLAQVAIAEVSVPPVDAYAWRVLIARRLYDHGAALAASPALAELRVPLTLGLHPTDADRLGLASGDEVAVRGVARQTALRVRIDEGLPRGVVSLDGATGTFDGDDILADVIEEGATVAQVRLETR